MDFSVNSIVFFSLYAAVVLKFLDCPECKNFVQKLKNVSSKFGKKKVKENKAIEEVIVHKIEVL